MKISISKLKQLISEAVKDEGSTVFGTYDELNKIISAMDADTVATKDYVDDETGEVFLEKGTQARKSVLHPQHDKDMSALRARRAAQREVELALNDTDELIHDELEAEKIKQEQEMHVAFDNAVKEFAESSKGYVQDNLTFPSETDQDFEGIARDIAENFFYSYPNWRVWGQVMNMSRAAMKEFVASIVYEAMIM